MKYPAILGRSATTEQPATQDEVPYHLWKMLQQRSKQRHKMKYHFREYAITVQQAKTQGQVSSRQATSPMQQTVSSAKSYDGVPCWEIKVKCKQNISFNVNGNQTTGEVFSWV